MLRGTPPKITAGQGNSPGYPPPTSREGKATCKRKFKLPWREAGPPSHHDDKEDSDQ